MGKSKTRKSKGEHLLVGYMRVSTGDQNLGLHRNALIEEAARIFDQIMWVEQRSVKVKSDEGPDFVQVEYFTAGLEPARSFIPIAGTRSVEQ